MARIDFSVVADEVTDDLAMRLTFDGEYHTFRITDGEMWATTFDFRDHQAKLVRDNLAQILRTLDRFIGGDRGGPTLETLRHHDAAVDPPEGTDA